MIAYIKRNNLKNKWPKLQLSQLTPKLTPKFARPNITAYHFLGRELISLYIRCYNVTIRSHLKLKYYYLLWSFSHHFKTWICKLNFKLKRTLLWNRGEKYYYVFIIRKSTLRQTGEISFLVKIWQFCKVYAWGKSIIEIEESA